MGSFLLKRQNSSVDTNKEAQGIVGKLSEKICFDKSIEVSGSNQNSTVNLSV